MVAVTIYGNKYRFEGLKFQEGTVNYHSRFGSAQLRDCRFEGNRFCDCDFTGANVFSTSCKEATFVEGAYRDAWFNRCDFSRVSFEDCIFIKTMFVKCNFTRARFANCVFIDCELRECQLGYIGDPSFCNGSIRGCRYIPYIPMTCPESGPIIGYKKAVMTKFGSRFRGRVDVIVKLEIPEDAKRSSALGRKCRCDKAKVLGIYAIKQVIEPVEVRESGVVETVIRHRIGSKFSDEAVAFSKYTSLPRWNGDVRAYKVGQWVESDYWDDDRFMECSHGIHFFLSAQEAVDY